MRRLLIHLKWVDKTSNNKIYNTLNYLIHNDEDVNYYLQKHQNNIKKYQVSFLK